MRPETLRSAVPAQRIARGAPSPVAMRNSTDAVARPRATLANHAARAPRSAGCASSSRRARDGVAPAGSPNTRDAASDQRRSPAARSHSQVQSVTVGAGRSALATPRRSGGSSPVSRKRWAAVSSTALAVCNSCTAANSRVAGTPRTIASVPAVRSPTARPRSRAQTERDADAAGERDQRPMTSTLAALPVRIDHQPRQRRGHPARRAPGAHREHEPEKMSRQLPPPDGLHDVPRRKMRGR